MGLPLARRPLAKRLLVLALASVFWLLVAEVAYRAFQALRGRPYSAEAAEARLDELIVNLRGLTGATVIAIDREAADVIYPTGDEELREGDKLILTGTTEAVQAAQGLLTPAVQG